MTSPPPQPGRAAAFATLTAILASWLIFGVSFIVHPWRDSIFILTGMGASIIAWLRLGRRPWFLQAGIILAQTLVFYVLAAETLPYWEKALHLRISPSLELGKSLQKRVMSVLQEARYDFFENATDDPLFFRRTPGSLHRYRYDHDPRNPLYETTVDETGYLNLNRGFYNGAPNVDIFFSGDSVLQGTGMPSCLETVKKDYPSLWNLSSSSYSPRQKVQALLAYALVKKPRLLIVEFYSGNDASEINEDAALAGQGSFTDRFAFADLNLRLLRDPRFRSLIIPQGPDILLRLRSRDLTLALSYYIVRQLKDRLARMIGRHSSSEAPLGGSATAGKIDHLFAYPAYSHFALRPELYDKWISAGLDETLAQYRVLADRVRGLPKPPRLAIMYNPSSYEIYRDLLVPADAAQDRRAEAQRNGLQDFASKNGFFFIDLLPALRKVVAGPQPVWLYGKSDPVHWSAAGTAVAAKVISRELRRAGFQPGLKNRSRP
ncbi:MAG TPA: hypothetical protein DEB40_00900 [Elusimicrobia bacterium]|nr:hypothetical protein [Elusimicrobiota bacterium]HBT60287.1 hypothetical protein [Elusimicrobiota bacterium]